MAKLVAVEWDKNEVRLAAGSRQGNTIALETLLTVPLVSESTEDTDADPGLAKALKEIAGKAGHAKGELIVGAGRTSVELRALQLPPASDNELPDMVRFAAQRQFAQLGDTWPIDFLKLPSKNAETIDVLAAAMNPATVSQVRKTCMSAGLTVSQLLLRPTAAGSLAVFSSSQIKGETVLLVDVLNDEADLVITEQGNVSFVRTARLPQGDVSATQRALSAEIKRTLIAAGNQRPSATVTKIIVWGDAASTGPLAAKLQESVGLPTTVLDPLDVVQSRAVRSSLPAGGSGRFAPLIGMLMQAAGCSQNGVDFLHPRKRVEKKKPVRQMALAGVVGGALVLFGGAWYFGNHWRLNSQIALLDAQDQDLAKQETDAKLQTAKWEQIEEFRRTDMPWLDKLDYLSSHSLPPDELIFNDLKMNVEMVSDQNQRGAKRRAVGKISAKIAGSSQSAMDQFIDAAKGGKFDVLIQSIDINPKAGNGYPIEASASVTLEAEPPMDPLKRPKPKTENNQPSEESPSDTKDESVPTPS